jgi:hypothetical protein
VTDGSGAASTNVAAGSPALASLPDELDLTVKPGEVESAAGLSRLEQKLYDPAPERERKRGLIALVLVAALCGIIVLAFAFVFVMPVTATNIEALKSVLEILFAPIVGLVGAVTGFYFGEKSR